MKNKTIISIIAIFIFIVSLSAVSAENFTDVNVNATMTNDEIQGAIDSAPIGAKVIFAPGEYTDVSLKVDKNLTFIGSGNNTILNAKSNISPKDSIFNVKAGETTSIAGVSFYNLKLVQPDDPGFYGRSIVLQGAEHTVIDSCTFINGDNGIRPQRSVGDITISNCYFEGKTNVSSVNDFGNKEQGTKAINAMGGKGVNIINNTFYGNLLDGASIASGASNIYVAGNKFINNWYGIFFGGGLNGITVTQNTFENCKKQSINLMKNSANIVITENKFTVNDDYEVIYLVQGDTHHGAATTIGNVTITDNIVDVTAGTDPCNVTFTYVESYGGPLTVSGVLNVTNNRLADGIEIFHFEESAWNDENGIIIYPDVFKTTISGKDAEIVSGDKFTVCLKDETGRVLVGKNVNFVLNGAEYNSTTDENGVAGVIIELNEGNYQITAKYTRDEVKYLDSALETYNITVSAKEDTDVTPELLKTTISGESKTIVSAVGNQFTVCLKDENNKVLIGKNVTFVVNGVEYNRTTDKNGVAGLNINLNAGKYTITAKYYSDETQYLDSELETYNLTTVPGITQIVGEDVTFDKPGNYYTITLLDYSSKPIANHVVIFHINGVKYYKVTDENGQASLKINLDPGIYNMYVKFDGTLQYQGTTGGSQVTRI